MYFNEYFFFLFIFSDFWLIFLFFSILYEGFADPMPRSQKKYNIMY